MKQFLFLIITLLLLTLSVSCANTQDTTVPESHTDTILTETLTTTDAPLLPEPEPPTAKTQYYELTVIDGAPGLVFTENFPPFELEDLEYPASHPFNVCFSSLADMKTTFLNGLFSVYDLQSYYRYRDKETGICRLPNLNYLFEPVLPNGSVEKITVYKSEYTFSVKLADGYQGTCLVRNAENVLDTIERATTFENVFGPQVTEHTVDPETGREELTVRGTGAFTKLVLREIKANGDLYTVLEYYDLSSSSSKSHGNPDLPFFYQIAAQKKNGLCFIYKLNNGTRPLTDEEITSLDFRLWQEE